MFYKCYFPSYSKVVLSLSDRSPGDMAIEVRSVCGRLLCLRSYPEFHASLPNVIVRNIKTLNMYLRYHDSAITLTKLSGGYQRSQIWWSLQFLLA